MVVLVPNGEIEGEEYRQYWLKAPLETLAKYCQKGMWHWKDKYDGETEIAPDKDGWGIPDSPSRPADNFEFRIDLPEDALGSPFISFEEFCEKANKR